MKELENRILTDGKIYSGDILKVDSFLNHQIDVKLLEEIADEFYKLYKEENITRILTIEASGIAIACMTAVRFGVPVVFAKKSKSKNIGDEVYTATVHSFTYDMDYCVTVSKDYLHESDRILIIDDFLAKGLAAQGLINIVNQSGATIAGLGICIEKSFQSGGKTIREQGYRVESLAKIKAFTEDKVIFE